MALVWVAMMNEAVMYIANSPDPDAALTEMTPVISYFLGGLGV
jgi:hypothetical protein